jgi:DNA topoisomerase-1
MEMLRKSGLLSRIASKIMMAMDFPNKKELDKYLKDHPAADKASHKVVEKSKGIKKEDVPVSRRKVKKEEPDREKNPALIEDEGDKSGMKYQTRSDDPEDYTAKMTKINPKNAIRRVTVGQDENGRSIYKWLQHGKPISKVQTVQIEKLAGGKAFSPGYEHVHVSDDPKAPLQAYMVDGKGIIHRQYSAEHDEKQAKIKFGRISHFNGDIHGMRDSVIRDQKQGKPQAFLLDLMDKTGFRVGDDKDTGAEKKAYGITTLQGRHVRVEGEKIKFLFTAKEGVVVARELMDVNLARFLSERVAKTKPNEKLFPDVSHAKFNDYMASISPEKRKYSAKDLRTYHGTLIASRVIKAGMPVHDEKERKELIKRACEESSNFLGNTPAMAKKSYIDKHLWSMIQITEGGQKAASIMASEEMSNLNEFIESTEFVDEKGKVIELPFEDIEEDDE